MKTGFYQKLAWESIRKNKRLYFPYILTGAVMVMSYYILSFLMGSPALSHVYGGSALSIIFPYGCGVIAIFSVLFLFYTNSFLIKQRYREFGLYNILGMDKRNIGKMMMWETLFTALFAIGFGLAAGIALSKGAELVLLNLLNTDIDYSLSISNTALYQTFLIYGCIYLLLLVYSLIKLRLSRPLELMQTGKAGERIPKRSWIFAVLGVIALGAAYYLAVTTKEPLAAFFIFFIAVVLVIIGTYLLFISGSVVFCRLLQKNKKYYYKANHFVSVSSMVYRMKRNGAGLASICILLTMVLVMISSTASLYAGAESSVRNRCPNDVNINAVFEGIDGISDGNLNMIREKIRACTGKKADLQGVRTCQIPGLFTEDGIIINQDNLGSAAFSYNSVGQLSVISIDDYNNMMNTKETLSDNQCLIYSDRLSYKWDTFKMEYGKQYNVKERLKDFQIDSESAVSVVPSVFLVVNDIYEFSEPVKDMKNKFGSSMMIYNWRCGFDTGTSEAESKAAAELNNAFKAIKDENGDFSYSVASRQRQRQSYYDLYGSLLFLGIMLSLVFLLAAVLIIYYKQISEGYEDQSRFEIMQKVGMTKKNIRKSINSQMLTVFFMPLLFAGVHLAFAFTPVSKIFLMFGFNNTLLSAVSHLICFGVFGIFYAVVYKITSNAYYNIVSGKKE